MALPRVQPDQRRSKWPKSNHGAAGAHVSGMVIADFKEQSGDKNPTLFGDIRIDRTRDLRVNSDYALGDCWNAS
jgi:hypothetical protein